MEEEIEVECLARSKVEKQRSGLSKGAGDQPEAGEGGWSHHSSGRAQQEEGGQVPETEARPGELHPPSRAGQPLSPA